MCWGKAFWVEEVIFDYVRQSLPENYTTDTVDTSSLYQIGIFFQKY